MRAALALLLLTSSLITRAQEMLGGKLPMVDGKVCYTSVAQRDSLTAQQIYTASRRWLVDTYKSMREVTQLDDPANHEVIARGWFPATWMVTFYAPTEVQVWHKTRVMAKEGRFKYEITDFVIRWYTAGAWFEKPLESWITNRPNQVGPVYDQINATVTEKLKGLAKAVQAVAEDDDW